MEGGIHVTETLCGDELDAAVHRAWAYGVNANPGPTVSPEADAQVRERVLPARSQRFATYARILVHDHDADAARLAALAEGCRTEGTRALAEGRAIVGYELALELIDLALNIIRDAGADAHPRARASLLAELDEEMMPHPKLYRRRPWDRHRLARRLLRRLDPRWHHRRRLAAREVALVRHPATSADDFHCIELMVGTRDVGALYYKVCHRWRIGYVGKLSINEEYQGLGLGSSVLEAAREEAAAPDYCWWTSHQDSSAQPFWQLIGSRTGAGYQFATESICPHVGE
jgi:GNAT superfamily N-acetyltransferase